MPYKRLPKNIRRKKRAINRKLYRKRRRHMKPTHCLIKAPTAVPDYLDIKLRYVEVGSKTGGGLTMNQAIYSGNSLFSPQVSSGYGTSHQPIGFDQWTALYRNYFVKASAIKVSFCASATAAMAVVPCQSTSVPSSIPGALEAARAKSLITTVANGRTNIKHYMTTASLYGLKNLNNDDSNYTAIFNADPSQNWYWTINYQDPAMSTNLVMNVRVEITYYVRFFNRINLATS